jgi:predicted NBD/HSP70 family sugar kinase
MNVAVSSTGSVRVANERAVYDLLCHGDGLSARELAEAAGLSKPTVGIALSELEQLGLVDQVGRRRGSTGRAPRIYRLRSAAGGALAIDVGRSWVRGARVDLAGRVLQRTELEADGRSAEALVDQILRLADDLSAGADDALISHTILGSPGVYDAAADLIRLAPNLPGWETTSVLTRLRGALPGELVVENDINLAALAELDHLDTRPDGPHTFVLVSVGTGLGMGIVSQGRLLRGARGAAGEISYLPADPSSTTSTRLEELTGSASIVRAAREAGLEAESAEAVFDAARRGSPQAQAVVEAEAERLSLALAAVVAVLDPPLIILGGGVGRNGDLLLGPVRADLGRRLPLPPPEIRISRLGVDAPLQGALADGLARCRHTAFAVATAETVKPATKAGV